MEEKVSQAPDGPGTGGGSQQPPLSPATHSYSEPLSVGALHAPTQHCGWTISRAFSLTPRAKRNQFVQRMGMEEISIDL